MPASEMMPIIVMRITKSIRKISNPKRTPIKLKTTDIEMIIGVLAELNWATNIKKIKSTAIKSALLRKAISSACFSCSPVKLISRPFGTSKSSMKALIFALTSVAL